MSCTQEIAIGSNISSQVCQMPNNAVAIGTTTAVTSSQCCNAVTIGSNISSQICQMPDNAISIGSTAAVTSSINYNNCQTSFVAAVKASIVGSS